MTVDFVLVNPNNKVPAPFAATEPPLWLGLIAGYHLQWGHTIAIIDAEMEGLNSTETIKRIIELDPAEVMIVVMGHNPSCSSTPKWPAAQMLFSHFPAAYLAGLHPVALAYPDALQEPFKGTPTVPWDFFDLTKYRAHNWHCLQDLDKRSPYAVLYTSLNCSYSCYYCNVHTLYGDHKVRFRPMVQIFQELDYFAREGIRNIKIWDECFTLNSKRVRQICDYIITNDYQFNMWAYARLDNVDPVLLSRMRMAGIRWLAYGFESIKDKKSRQADMAIRLTRECGLNIIANFMFGLPGETEDDWKASLDCAVQNNFEWANFQVALPYPGSAWWDSLKEKPTDWARFSQYHPDMYGDPRAIAFREYAFRHYFTRPEYLDMIRKRFGEKAKRHIKEMLQWKIK